MISKQRRKYLKNYQKKNKDRYNQLNKNWRLENPIRHNKIQKKSYLKRKLKRREWENNYQKERRKIDKNYLIKRNVVSLLRHSFKDYLIKGKIYSSSKYGINYKTCIKRLIEIMPRDFTLKKYTIDHIKPLSKFDLTNPKELRKAFSPNNLQWLTMKDNLKKGII